MYGTLAAKGDNTEERPHRPSKILKSPLRVAVTAEQLRVLVEELQPVEPTRVEPPAAHNGTTFDVEDFLTQHGVEVSERTTEPDGTIKWKLKHCPFNHDHVNGEAAVFHFLNGKLGFKCFHSSCTGKHWKDFRQHFEPERKTPRIEVQSEGDIEPVELPPAPNLYVPPPLTLLPTKLQKYVHAAAESLNVDVASILLPLLSSLGTAIGSSRSIFLKRGFIQPPNIWSAITGRSGARKSPALEAGCFALMEHELELMRQNKTAAELYDDELSNWERKKGQNPRSVPRETILPYLHLRRSDDRSPVGFARHKSPWCSDSQRRTLAFFRKF